MRSTGTKSSPWVYAHHACVVVKGIVPLVAREGEPPNRRSGYPNG